VATTLRESISADFNNWGAILYDAKTGTAHFAPLDQGRYQPYQITDIVDRVGGGDSFAAGLVYGLSTAPYRDEPGTALAFAVAASCLCHSIKGDVNFTTVAEVEALMSGNKTGRVQR
jgi:2-dehydro-3-deoxygluconokinase